MKVVYHEGYNEVYSGDPASALGRIESIYKELYGSYEFVTPNAASDHDLELVHGETHIQYVKRLELTYEVAKLAVGGAIRASELAVEGEPAFGLIRPPGHHASRDSSWGFCYFNNVAIAVEKLRQSRRIERALIVDIDLHYGDGTANIFSNRPDVSYFHMPHTDGLEKLSEYLEAKTGYGILALSAGFDRHVDDWGGTLRTEDYRTIGITVKKSVERECEGKRFAVLEGGYNHSVLGKNVKALLSGMT